MDPKTHPSQMTVSYVDNTPVQSTQGFEAWNNLPEALWKLETTGIRDCTSDEDVIAWQQFQSSVEFKDGRYNVAWPWRNYPPELPPNYNLAVRSLKTLIRRRFKPNPELFAKCKTIIEDQMEKKVIEKVTPELVVNEQIMHYLPYHPQ